MGLLLASFGASCEIIPPANPAASYLLLQDGGRILLGDCGGALLLQAQEAASGGRVRFAALFDVPGGVTGQRPRIGPWPWQRHDYHVPGR